MSPYRIFQDSAVMPLKPFTKIIFENKDFAQLPVILEDMGGRRYQVAFAAGDKIAVNVERTSEGYFFRTEQKFNGESLNVYKLDANGGGSADDFVFKTNGDIRYWAASNWFKSYTIARSATGHFEGQVIDKDGINKHPSAYLEQSVQGQTLTIAFSSEEQLPGMPLEDNAMTLSPIVEAA